MKAINYIFSISVLALIASCSNETIGEATKTDEPTVEVLKDIKGSIPDLVIDSADVTRSVVTFSNQDFGFQWDNGEKITIYGDAGNNGDFTLTSGEGDKLGIFTGGGFTLTEGKSYYTISKSKSAYDEGKKHNIPLIDGSYDSFNADQYTNIKMSYAGQRQKYNGNSNAVDHDKATEHLGAYDYLTAVATANEYNACHFMFKRLGCIVRVVFRGLPQGVKYTKMTMYDASEDIFRNEDRTMNITNTKGTTDYEPYYNDAEISASSARFSIMLGDTTATGEEQGLSVDDTAKSLVVYMMIPPVDLSNRTIVFRLTPLEGQGAKPYYATYTRTTPFEANTAYGLGFTPVASTQYTFNIKVMQNWAKGNVATQTRATGDPGTTTSDDLPKYLYVFFVNDGKLVQTASVGSESGLPWTTADNISTLGNVTWNINGGSTTTADNLTMDNSNPVNPRVYVIGSPTPITNWYIPNGSSQTEVTLQYGTTNGTSEETIRSFVYQYTDQATTKAIFSTPYSSSDFVGSIGNEDDVKEIRLYHVASKVDINWENNKTQTYGGYTTPVPLSGSVSLNNIPTTNLSYFQPTTNAAGTTTVSAPDITTGTAYSGRAVWYVPQIKGGKYNVTIGSGTNATQDITFTPDATYTSWFRGLVTVK